MLITLWRKGARPFTSLYVDVARDWPSWLIFLCNLIAFDKNTIYIHILFFNFVFVRTFIYHYPELLDHSPSARTRFGCLHDRGQRWDSIHSVRTEIQWMHFRRSFEADPNVSIIRHLFAYQSICFFFYFIWLMECCLLKIAMLENNVDGKMFC